MWQNADRARGCERRPQRFPVPLHRLRGGQPIAAVGTSAPGRGIRPIELVGGFESTYLPGHDVDVVELTGHDLWWRDDLRLMRDLGVRQLRYPVRWHRIEPEPGRYDWRATDAVLGHMAEQGMRPIVDLVHHTSYPRWLTGGFGDRRFRSAYLRYVERFATRYPHVERYTLFNEPFATLFLCGSQSVWPPHGTGIHGFARLLTNVLPAVVEASRMTADLLPGAAHVWVDTCEWHAADGGHEPSIAHAALCNDRRVAVPDPLLGGDLTDRPPFLPELCRAGGEELMGKPRGGGGGVGGG